MTSPPPRPGRAPAAAQTPPAAAPDTAQALRSKLIRRMAVAGVLVALLLGTLTLFDYLAAPPEDEEAAVFTRPVPVPPKKEVSQPVTASSNLPPPPEKPLGTEVPVPPAPEPPPAPAPAPTPTVEAPPPPSVAASPVARPESRSEKTDVRAPARPLPIRPSPVEPSAGRSLGTRPAAPLMSSGVEERTSAPPLMPAESAPAPTARVVQVPPAPLPPTTVGRLFSGFILQAGTFTSVQRAEELHARLALSGVPSSVETRVQVGPFRTRQEAEAAQARLRALGIETVLVPPQGSRR